MLTPYQAHKRKWKDCTECSLYERRKKVVLARGSLPCDVLFIGEAPGASEDVVGRPFVGPAGKLLDYMIREASFDSRCTYALTNLVACVPKGEDGYKIQEPEPSWIKACNPRLQDLVRIANPKTVVLVGKLAQRYIARQATFGGKWDSNNEDYDEDARIKFEAIVHPAAILRVDVSRQLVVQRTIAILREIVEGFHYFQ